jgi:two-component system, response regulator YesN
MYKVMLADDDYPVLELLSEAVGWGELGVALQSIHENGASAFDQAMIEMPDILITDIGMPKMNGIELTKKLKELNPNLQVAILSCHSDFEYAQQALKLQVQDYLVKDTFAAEDMSPLIEKFKENLDGLNKHALKQIQMNYIIDQNQVSVKERFIRKTIDPSASNEKEWVAEADSLGLCFDTQGYIGSLATINHYHTVKRKFISEETLHFEVNKVIAEAIEKCCPGSVPFKAGEREIIIFFPSSLSFKMNILNEVSESMKRIQYELRKSLNISLSFIAGKGFRNFKECKQEVQNLLNCRHQRFYMMSDTIAELKEPEKSSVNLFSKYDEAAAEMRELMMLRDRSSISGFIEKWISFLEEKQCSPEQVKDWVLKLLLDLKMKLQALQFFRSDQTAESLHNEILVIQFLDELKDWLNNYFKAILTLVDGVYEQTRRKEILDTFKYVSINIEKKISLDEVSSYLYLNPSYFSRLFKKEVGETFVEYVTKMKINRAKELLEQTADSVGKICERLGYDNQSYFIKIFKSYAGVTPIEYRSGKA